MRPTPWPVSQNPFLKIARKPNPTRCHPGCPAAPGMPWGVPCDRAAFPQRKPYGAEQCHQVPQEIWGSEVELSRLPGVPWRDLLVPSR